MVSRRRQAIPSRPPAPRPRRSPDPVPAAAPPPGPRARDWVRPLEAWLPALAFLAWLLLGLFLVLHHEPWRDEADGWLATRDASLPDLLRFTNYVGVPGLWFWLQLPFARLGLPYVSLGLLNLACAAVAVALVLWRAPFPLALRVAFAFGYFAAYEYAVVARSYALAMALIFGLAALHARRFARPLLYGALLLLLFNTNLHGALIGAPMLAAFAWDALRRRASRPLAGAGIAILGGVLMVVQLWPPPDGQLQGVAPTIEWRLIPATLAGALLPTAEDTFGAWVLAALTFGLVALACRRSARALWALGVSCAGLWALFLLKYPGGLRHWGFLLLAMLYAWWVARVEAADAEPGVPVRDLLQRAAAAAVLVAFAWSVWVAAEFWRRDARDPFSASKALAAWLAEQRMTDVPIAAWPGPHCESILPWLPGTRFYDPGARRWGTYMRWDRETEPGVRLPEPEVVRRVVEAFPRGDVVLIANQPMASAGAAGFRLIHAAIGPVMMGDEQYFVYRRGP